jgi:SSS family solute:Na+ symporter
MDLLVITLYMAAMIAIGWFARRRANTESDYLVAGRRLGPMLYSRAPGSCSRWRPVWR